MIKKSFNLLNSLKSQYNSLDSLYEYRDKKLKQLINYVYRNNKFYHELYKKNNISIRKIKGYDDLVKLPIVTKSDLQKNSNIILNTPSDKYLQIQKYKSGIIRRTGGSTGTPLYVYFDKNAWNYSESIYARSLLGTGYNPFEVLVNSNPFLIPEKRWFNNFGLFRKDFIPVETSAIETISRLNNYKNKFTFYTYPTILRNISSYMDSKIPNINRIISTGELLNEKIRKELELKFETKIYNHYGSMECNRIAWECKEQEGMHLDVDSLGIEFVKNDEHVSFGESGQVVLTNLHNYSFPLIRYNQGDYAVPIEDKCSCGRNLPMIKELLGRDNDFIVLKDKTKMSPIPFDVILSKMSGMSQFKLIQKSVDKFELYVILNESKNSNKTFSETEVVLALRNLLKTNVFDVSFKYVSTIPRSKGGKLRSVVSEI